MSKAFSSLPLAAEDELERVVGPILANEAVLPARAEGAGRQRAGSLHEAGKRYLHDEGRNWSPNATTLPNPPLISSACALTCSACRRAWRNSPEALKSFPSASQTPDKSLTRARMAPSSRHTVALPLSPFAAPCTV